MLAIFRLYHKYKDCQNIFDSLCVDKFKTYVFMLVLSPILPWREDLKYCYATLSKDRLATV